MANELANAHTTPWAFYGAAGLLPRIRRSMWVLAMRSPLAPSRYQIDRPNVDETDPAVPLNLGCRLGSFDGISDHFRHLRGTRDPLRKRMLAQ